MGIACRGPGMSREHSGQKVVTLAIESASPSAHNPHVDQQRPMLTSLP